MKEERLHLIDTTGSNEDEVENGEQTQLKVECTFTHHPEGETTEERRKDVQDNLVPHVVLPYISENVSRA